MRHPLLAKFKDGSLWTSPSKLILIRAGHAVADFAVSCGYALLRFGHPHIRLYFPNPNDFYANMRLYIRDVSCRNTAFLDFVQIKEKNAWPALIRMGPFYVCPELFTIFGNFSFHDKFEWAGNWA